jgi:hypothetical protein
MAIIFVGFNNRILYIFIRMSAVAVSGPGDMGMDRLSFFIMLYIAHATLILSQPTVFFVLIYPIPYAVGFTYQLHNLQRHLLGMLIVPSSIT